MIASPKPRPQSRHVSLVEEIPDTDGTCTVNPLPSDSPHILDTLPSHTDSLSSSSSSSSPSSEQAGDEDSGREREIADNDSGVYVRKETKRKEEEEAGRLDCRKWRTSWALAIKAVAVSLGSCLMDRKAWRALYLAAKLDWP